MSFGVTGDPGDGTQASPLGAAQGATWAASGTISGLLTHLTSNAAGTYTGASTNLVSLPSEVKVTDGAGHLLSDTKPGYDGEGMANCAGIIGHDNVNFAGGGTRGNLTSVEQYADGNNGRNTFAFLTALQNAKGQTTFTSNLRLRQRAAVLWLGCYRHYSLNSYGSGGLAADRLIETVRGYNTNNATQTKCSYAATTNRLTYHDQNTAGDEALESEQKWDDFGRPDGLEGV